MWEPEPELELGWTLQRFVDPKPIYMGLKPREMDPVGFITILPDVSLGIKDRGSEFDKCTQGSQIQGREGVVHF